MISQPPEWAKVPNKFLVKYVNELKKGTVLDLGGSNGLNAVYLAQHGFSVTNVDRDIEALNILDTFSKASALDINVVNADLNRYAIKKDYDNILSFYTFHFLTKSNGEMLIKDIQNKTRSGGLNILIGFTNNGEFKPSILKHYFVENYLLDTYKSWKILHHEKYIGSTKSGLNQEREVLVARKIKSR